MVLSTAPGTGGDLGALMLPWSITHECSTTAVDVKSPATHHYASVAQLVRPELVGSVGTTSGSAYPHHFRAGPHGRNRS